MFKKLKSLKQLERSGYNTFEYWIPDSKSDLFALVKTCQKVTVRFDSTNEMEDDLPFYILSAKDNNLSNNCEKIWNESLKLNCIPDILKFKSKTKLCFNKKNMTVDEIECWAKQTANDLFEANEFKAVAVNAVISGSRCRGMETKNSDIDIVLYVIGSEREDVLFDLLNENKMDIDGIRVDLNPITYNKTGSLANYLQSVEKYLKGKMLA